MTPHDGRVTSVIHEGFSMQARRSPGAQAVAFGDTGLTYGELEARANRLAHLLRRLGVGPEARVGIVTDRSPDLVVGMLGILKAGGAYVPMDPAFPLERLEFMVRDVGVAMVVTHDRWLQKVQPLGVHTICLDRDADAIARQDGDAPDSGATADHLAYAIFTSGSTGQPKAVGVVHRAVTRLVLDTDYLRIEATDRVALASNLCFDAATFEIWGALLNGACVVGMAPETVVSPDDLKAALENQGVTTLFLTTALLHLVARERAEALRGLRHLLFGGDTLDPQVIRPLLNAAPGPTVLHMYGPTETTTFATWHRIEKAVEPAAAIPIGHAIAGSRAYVLDELFRPVAPETPGEIFIGGAGVARGYLNRPELTAERFLPDPYSAEPGARLYRTGDLAKRLSDGSLQFLGRRDHQVKVRGFRVELGEIEHALRQADHVKEAAVVVREDEPGDKRLVAYVAWDANHHGGVGALRRWLRERLPEYLLPAAIVPLWQLPLSPHHKVDRAALVALPPPVSDASFPLGEPGIEDVVAAVWQEVLRHRDFGMDDHFFEVGGNSLLLLRMQDGVELSLGRTLAVADLLRYPTIRSLAAFLENPDRTPSRVAAARDRGAARRLPTTDRGVAAGLRRRRAI